MTPQVIKKISFMRSEGFFTLFLSNCILALTAGISGWWVLIKIYKFSTKSESKIPNNQTVFLVLGKQLVNGKPDHDYTQRLIRAKVLLENSPENWVVILGGITGNEPISEASAGKNFLLENGIENKQIFIEDKSLNTLENLQLARDTLAKSNNFTANHRVVLISNRYHLARAHAMATGMKISHTLCAAEKNWVFSSKHLVQLLIEAYFLHWYYSGKQWSLWTNNKKWLLRIT